MAGGFVGTADVILILESQIRKDKYRAVVLSLRS